MQGILAVSWSDVFSKDLLGPAIRIGVLLVVGFPLLLAFAALVARSAKKRLTPQSSMLVRKGIVYFGTILIFISVLHQSGFKLTAYRASG